MTSPYARAARPFVWAVGTPAVSFLAAAVLLPMAGLFAAAFRESWTATFEDPTVLRTLAFTYAQALLSATAATALGVVAGTIVAERDSGVARAFERVSLATVALPPIVFASGLFAAFGRAGWLGDFGISTGFFGVGPLLIAHVLFNVPLAAHLVATGVRRLDRTPEATALTLGAGPFPVAWSVTLPRLGPETATAFLLAFLFSATSFMLPLLVGASPRYATVEVAIFQLLSVEGRVGAAAQLALLHLTVCALVLAVLPRRRVPAGARAPVPLYRERRRKPFFWSGVFLAITGLAGLGLPFLALLAQGVRGATALAAHSPSGAWAGTALAAFVAATAGTALAMPLGYFAARGGVWATRVSTVLAFLPLAFSPLLLFFAWRTVFGLDTSESSGTATLVVVGLVHAITTLPLGFRYCLDAFSAVDPAALQVAATLGAGPVRRFLSLELPTVAPAIVGVAALFAAVSSGEAGAVMLAGHPDVSTLPLAMYRAMAQYRFGVADALGALLLLVVSTLLLLSGAAARRAGART